MGVDPSGVLDKATWWIAFRMWWWLWWRHAACCWLGIVVIGVMWRSLKTVAIGALLVFLFRAEWLALIFAMGKVPSELIQWIWFPAMMLCYPMMVLLQIYLHQKVIGQSFQGVSVALLKNEGSHPPVMVHPTWGTALKMWWWVALRQLIMSLSSVLLIGWICHMTGLDQLVFMLLTPIWLELLAIYLYHEMIGQSFGGLRVVLCQPDEAS